MRTKAFAFVLGVLACMAWLGSLGFPWPFDKVAAFFATPLAVAFALSLVLAVEKPSRNS